MLMALAVVQMSCGFHPRGVVGLPDQITPIFLDLNLTDDDIGLELRRLLSSSNEDDLAILNAEAKTVLTISNVQKKRRVVAVDNIGRAREYELNYQFSYELKIASASDDKAEIIKTNRVEIKRDVIFDPSNVLASGDESEALYEDMRKDAASMVLRQLSIIKPSTQQKK